jgi:hypothetical protein
MKNLHFIVGTCFCILSTALPGYAQPATTNRADIDETPVQSPYWENTRASVRGGYDRNWELDRNLNAIGIEIASVQRRPHWNNFRLEGGGTASVMGDNDDAFTGSNAHATIFPSLDFNGFVFGPRGLAGLSWEQETDLVRPDVGGEGRLGFQADTYSVFFSAGRTLELTRVGLDVGAIF